MQQETATVGLLMSGSPVGFCVYVAPETSSLSLGGKPPLEVPELSHGCE